MKPILPQLAGKSLGKVVKRILKRPVLALLRWLEADVEENWQRSQDGR